MNAEARCIVLFAHGARDPRWSRTLVDLQARVQQRAPHALVRVAFLEFQSPSLTDVLVEAVAAGCQLIDVVPVFWSSGGHVAEDLPPLLDELRSRHPEVNVRLLPVLSELPGLLDFVADAVVGPSR